MANTFEITEAKIASASTQAEEDLRASVQAITRRNAAKGMLKSGATMIEVARAGSAAIDHVCRIASSALSWAIDHEHFTTPRTIDVCNSIGHRYLGEVKKAALVEVNKIVALCQNENARAQVEAEVESQWQKSIVALSLALDTKYHELKFQRARAIFGILQKLLSYLLGNAK